MEDDTDLTYNLTALDLTETPELLVMAHRTVGVSFLCEMPFK